MIQTSALTVCDSPGVLRLAGVGRPVVGGLNFTTVPYSHFSPLREHLLQLGRTSSPCRSISTLSAYQRDGATQASCPRVYTRSNIHFFRFRRQFRQPDLVLTRLLASSRSASSSMAEWRSHEGSVEAARGLHLWHALLPRGRCEFEVEKATCAAQ